MLGYRNISRLQATTGLLGLGLMADSSSDTWLMESLSSEFHSIPRHLNCPGGAGVCSSSATEESVETLSGQLELSEFVIKPGMLGKASHLTLQ